MLKIDKRLLPVAAALAAAAALRGHRGPLPMDSDGPPPAERQHPVQG